MLIILAAIDSSKMNQCDIFVILYMVYIGEKQLGWYKCDVFSVWTSEHNRNSNGNHIF